MEPFTGNERSMLKWKTGKIVRVSGGEHVQTTYIV